ncbi:fumarylacetoacetate hydrolase family protein [Cupriavidus sp. D39]|uniref:fumarylacetoacetate hydrolase family protein n=1 Tax=Cupriavidus sp. D39 TaxID=2997877 RepID=UPI002270AF11|nr:fumarylacetoacetate hydrolase family protein [Cupriavidus sp. D39]MCY0855772.1 fumarylacetoacetate hydrolase family protein [Cupriavidus sp. D39]
MILATFADARHHAAIGHVDRAGQRILALRAAALALELPDECLTDMLSLMRSGPVGMARAREVLARTPDDSKLWIPLAAVQLLAPVPVPEQMRDFSVFERHMKQAGAAIARLRAARTGDTAPLPTPDQIRLPEVFYTQPLYYKANRFSVVGPEAEIRWPRACSRLDYEVEFGIFIGKAGRDIPPERAMEHVFGFTLLNDFSARDLQEQEMAGPFGPAKGKDFDTGNAMGPWIVTPDELPNPYSLAMISRINGVERSRGDSAAMVHRFEQMIAHVSRDETLHPGEFMGSGTVGNGSGLERDEWLADGDLVEIEIPQIGMLRNRVRR